MSVVNCELRANEEIRRMHADIASCLHWSNDGCDLDSSHADCDVMEGFSVAICTHLRPAVLGRFLDSLARQDRKPQRLVIVDASPDDQTEQMLKDYPAIEQLGSDILYFRVAGSLRGLTRQRNFALRWIPTDLMAFFDDDIVLLPGCLDEMEQPHRLLGDRVMGVAAFSLNESSRADMFWRLRVLLRIVPRLEPGGYARSGFSIPWRFMGPTESLVEGNWLRGCAAMWKTVSARSTGFNEAFAGYGSGEDLDFSLRIGVFGSLLMAGKARVLHLSDVPGRPDAYLMGYKGVRNAYAVHRRCLARRTWKDSVWFVYAYGLDAVMRGVNLLMPGPTRQRWQFLRGRLRFFRELLSGGLKSW